MQTITPLLLDIESYLLGHLGYDTAKAKIEFESDGTITIWINGSDALIQKAPYDDRVLQVNTYEHGKSISEAREAIWEYLYKECKPRDEREFAFAIRRMATLAGAGFSTFVGQFIAGQMKKAIEDVGRLLESPRAGEFAEPQAGSSEEQELDDEIPF